MNEVIVKIEQLLLDNKTQEAKQIIFSELNNPENEKILPNLYSCLGKSYAIEGKTGLALQYFTQSYELAPNNEEILMTICNFLIANGKPGEAAKLIDIFQNNNSNMSQEPAPKEENFNYLDFILGGGDALSYGADATSENNPGGNLGTTAVAEETKETEKNDWTASNYFDLIFAEGAEETEESESIQSEKNIETEQIINNLEENDNLEKNINLEENINLETLLAKYTFVDDLDSNLEDNESSFENSNSIDSNNKTPEDEKLELKEQIDPNKNINIIKKPRLLFTMYGWNESGGGTTFPKAFIKELAKRGFQVAVFYATGRHETIKDAYYLEHKTEDSVELFGVYNRPTTFFDVSEPLREIKDENIVALFKKIVEEFKPDVVNFHNFLGLSFELANVTKEMNIVSTYTPYNYHLIDPQLYMYSSDLVSWSDTDFMKNSPLPTRYPVLVPDYQSRIDAAKKLLTETVDYTFAVSSRVKDILVDFVSGGALNNFTNSEIDKINKRICVVNQVHNTIAPLQNKILNKQDNLSNNFSNALSSNIRFLFIGAVLPHKGAHIIAQAAQMINTNKNIHFDIYGFYNEEYGAAIKAIDKSNLITLHGEYFSDDLLEISKNADVAILPSLWEDCAPFVITEYLSMGLPVIASNIGGVFDFIKEGHNGSYFQTGDPRALASVLQALIDNPFKILQMQKNCRVNMQFEDYVEHKINIYMRLFAGDRPGANELELRYKI